MTIEIGNLTDLKAEIDAWAKRTIGSQVDKFITLAEQRIVRSFAKNGLQGKLVETATITAGETFVLPAGTRAIEAMYLDINPKQLLRYMTPDAFFSRWISSETGKPKAYTQRGKVIHLGPSPDDTYSIELWYRRTPNIISPRDQRLIEGQTEDDYDDSPTSEGTFAPGTGYAVGDVITLSNGSKVTVYGLSGSAVANFTITTGALTSLATNGDSLTQSSTTGSGTGFSLTVGTDNIAPQVFQDHPELYLYGALIEAYSFYRNKAEREYFIALFEDAISDLEEEAFNLGGALQMYNPQAGAGAPKLHR